MRERTENTKGYKLLKCELEEKVRQICKKKLKRKWQNCGYSKNNTF